jgi:uncharacterized UPF0146 family protein
MNIITVKTIPGQESFQLKENDDTVLEICYKTELHTARVRTNNERRVLIIEDESFLKIKLAIKNEYGVPIGSLTWDNFSDTQGSVEIEGIKFRFIIADESSPYLEIYKNRKLIYSCQMALDKSSIKEMRSHSSSSVIAVTWYLCQKMLSVQPASFIA